MHMEVLKHYIFECRLFPILSFIWPRISLRRIWISSMFLTVSLYLCNNFPFFTSQSYFLHNVLRFPLEELWWIWDFTLFAIKLPCHNFTDTSRETEVLWVRDKEVPLHSKSNSKSYIVALDGQASTPMKCDGEGQVIPTYTASGDVL